MKENSGITLIVLILIVVILSLLGTIIIKTVTNTYENTKILQFTSYMKAIQKKVDFYLEDGTDIKTLGKVLNSADKGKLQTIINENSGNIKTTNVNSDQIRYFNSDDIYKYFDLADIKDDIVVNFANREVISLNGVEKNDRQYYVEKGL